MILLYALIMYISVRQNTTTTATRTAMSLRCVCMLCVEKKAFKRRNVDKCVRRRNKKERKKTCNRQNNYKGEIKSVPETKTGLKIIHTNEISIVQLILIQTLNFVSVLASARKLVKIIGFF